MFQIEVGRAFSLAPRIINVCSAQGVVGLERPFKILSSLSKYERGMIEGLSERARKDYHGILS